MRSALPNSRFRITAFFVIWTLLLVFGHSAYGAGAPVLSGCPVLPEDNIWNTPIDTLPLDPQSSAYMTSIGATTAVHPDFGAGLWDGGPIGIPYNVVPGSQAKVPVSFDYADESDPGPYPIPSNALIEGGPSSSGDRHVLVLDKDSCKLYETWSSYPQPNGSWQAGSGAVFDLRSNALRPDGWTSSDAAGLPILPGLLRYDEVLSGEIKHAIRFTAPRTRRAYVWPARHYASSLTGTQYPPMGQRFRLKSNFDTSRFSAPVQVILTAMKRYGMILADNGSAWYVSGVPDERWNNDTLVRELAQVKGSDFEAVDVSSLMIHPDSGKALQPVSALNPSAPTSTARLVFMHHSTGQNWLADDNGGLGIALRNNNYFVSDTNYGWGPNSIGDRTDIGHWWLWFRGPEHADYLQALYAEAGQHSAYSRLQVQPDGDGNEVILLKSCFPNSNLGGEVSDPVPSISENPLAGLGSDSPYHTIANAKSIYLDLLKYFETRQDKLFVVITAPPLSDPAHAANARAFNDWLMNGWLNNYPYDNVAVFDFYNVLTSNGGSATNNDLGRDTGNHHRWWQGSIEHVTNGDNDASPNVLEYPSASGDDHPSKAGNLKATGEFLPLLNIHYNCWKGTGGCPAAAEANPAISVQPAALSLGSVQVGQNSQPGTVTVRNVGTADLHLGAITTTGVSPDAFVISSDACSSETLSPSSQCTIQIVFSPDSIAPLSAALSVPSDDPGNPTATVSLLGTGTAGPSIAVVQPNGGEQWRMGTTCPISWTHTGNVGKWVKIELLADGVLKRRLTARASVGSNGAGAYSWRIPARFVAGTYTIRITSTTKINGGFVTDSSDAPFSIIK